MTAVAAAWRKTTMDWVGVPEWFTVTVAVLAFAVWIFVSRNKP
jgi:hypothetical protein